MNAHREDLARDREILVHRSQLVRLRLRRETRMLRDSLHWRRAAVAVATAPTARRIALGLVLSLAGAGRTARLVMIAGRIVLLAKLARALFDGVRSAWPVPRVRYRASGAGSPL